MPSTPVTILDSTMTDIADAIRGKNGSSDTYKPSEMPSAITAIPSGGGGGIPREVNANGVYGAPIDNFTFSLPANARDASTHVLEYAFNSFTTLTSVDLSSLTAVSGDRALNYAFNACTHLTSADLSSLATVSGASAFSHAFYGCTTLTSVDLSSLTTVTGSQAFGDAFNACTGLTSIDLSSLTTVSGGSAFRGVVSNCAHLTSVDLSSLTTVTGSQAFGSAFAYCYSLTSLSFPALTTSSFGSYTNQFTGMLAGVSDCTIHFPAAIQSIIEGMTGYPNFSGYNTTVLFDL